VATTISLKAPKRERKSAPFLVARDRKKGGAGSLAGISLYRAGERRTYSIIRSRLGEIREADRARYGQFKERVEEANPNRVRGKRTGVLPDGDSGASQHGKWILVAVARKFAKVGGSGCRSRPPRLVDRGSDLKSATPQGSTPRGGRS